jgi:cytochrome c oxidase assembly protein subunit 15
LAYGKLLPPIDAESVARYNQQRLEVTALNSITATQIGLQLVHRLLAAIIIIIALLASLSAWRKLGLRDPVSRLGLLLIALILVQAGLGAATIWSNKAADIATAHVVVGLLSLATSSITCILTFRERKCQPVPVTESTKSQLKACALTVRTSAASLE